MKKSAVVLSVACMVAVVQAEVISVNFYKVNTPKINTSMFRGVVTDWTWGNLQPDDAKTYNFEDVDGSPMDVQTSAAMELTGSDNAWRGSVCFNGLRADQKGDAVVTLSEIPYKKYYIIAYVCGWGSPYRGEISCGTVFKYFDFLSVPPKEMVESTDTDLTDGIDSGSYVVFGSESEPLTGSTCTLTVTKISGAPAIGGLQVVAVQ